MVQWCISPPALTELCAWEPAATFWQMFLLSNMGFIALRQNRFCCQSQRTAATGRSRRRSRARRHLRAGFPAPVLCSHPPSAAPAQAKPTAEPWTSCSPLWVQPPTWLVPGAGLGHSQCCFKPIYSHFRGESSLKSFGTFLQGFAFQRPWFQPSTCPFLFLQHFIDFFFTTQKPYLSKCVKHPKTGMLYSTDLNFEMYQHSLTSSLLIKDLSEHSQQENIK